MIINLYDVSKSTIEKQRTHITFIHIPLQCFSIQYKRSIPCHEACMNQLPIYDSPHNNACKNLNNLSPHALSLIMKHLYIIKGNSTIVQAISSIINRFTYFLIEVCLLKNKNALVTKKNGTPILQSVVKKYPPQSVYRPMVEYVYKRPIEHI